MKKACLALVATFACAAGAFTAVPGRAATVIVSETPGPYPFTYGDYTMSLGGALAGERVKSGTLEFRAFRYLVQPDNVFVLENSVSGVSSYQDPYATWLTHETSYVDKYYGNYQVQHAGPDFLTVGGVTANGTPPRVHQDYSFTDYFYGGTQALGCTAWNDVLDQLRNTGAATEHCSVENSYTRFAGVDYDVGTYSIVLNLSPAALAQINHTKGLTLSYIGSVDHAGYSFGTDATVTLQTGVPEPAAWSLMVLAFGIAGAALRRRPAQGAA